MSSSSPPTARFLGPVPNAVERTGQRPVRIAPAPGTVRVRPGGPVAAPRVLLTTTCHVPSTSRLAVALSRAGCEVMIICPPNHAVRHIRAAPRRFAYSALYPLRSLEIALARAAPDLVVPCDERTVRHLHRLHATTANIGIRTCLERSLGSAGSFAVAECRSDLLALARRAGALVPDSRAIDDVTDLQLWGAEQPFPWVLKADGSWAGHGVRIVSTLEQAVAAFHGLRRPVPGLLALRQIVLESDSFLLAPWVGQDRSAISIQRFIRGRPANCGLACWNGEILSGIYVEVEETESATGAATVVRPVDGGAMREAAARVVKTLELTGFVGFDFMIEESTGAAYMIEMNPRVTPACALQLGQGRDPVAAMVSRLSGRPARERQSTQHDLIAYFPQPGWQDLSGPLLHAAHHDIPWDEPALLRELLKPERRESHWLFRRLRPAWRRLSSSRGDPEADPAPGL